MLLRLMMMMMMMMMMKLLPQVRARAPPSTPVLVAGTGEERAAAQVSGLEALQLGHHARYHSVCPFGGPGPVFDTREALCAASSH